MPRKFIACLSLSFLGFLLVGCQGEVAAIDGGDQLDAADLPDSGQDDAGELPDEDSDAGQEDAGMDADDDGGVVADQDADAGLDGGITTDSEPVRLWDLGQAYGTGLSMAFVGWADREQWTQVPYDTTPEAIENDVALEGPTFYFNITWRSDSYIAGPVLYRKPDWQDDDLPRHNLLYRAYFTPNSGLWDGGANLGWIKVVKNTAEEVIVESAAKEGYRDGTSQVVANYGVKRGKPWLEITPVSQCSVVAMHGESRFAVCPEAEDDGSDYVYDSLPIRGDDDGRSLVHGKMLLDFVMDDDNLWAMMITPAEPNSDPDSDHLPMDYQVRRYLLSIQIDGYHAGWSHIGEGACGQVVSAPYAIFLGQKIALAHRRVGHWHYQKIDQAVQQGQPVAIHWHYAYERQVKDSPFTPGGDWWFLYPGTWRIISRIDDKYYTTSLDILSSDLNKADFSYQAPASGQLQYVLLYLYDRNQDTAEDFYTLMDIYREAILAP